MNKSPYKIGNMILPQQSISKKQTSIVKIISVLWEFFFSSERMDINENLADEL